MFYYGWYSTDEYNALLCNVLVGQVLRLRRETPNQSEAASSYGRTERSVILDMFCTVTVIFKTVKLELRNGGTQYQIIKLFDMPGLLTSCL
jgi:hypothetical protein